MTGGYFADPGAKDVDRLAQLGFPIAVLSEHGDVEITKVTGSGGRVTTATCKEQLLYEIHDPREYITPDVVADFGHVRVRELAPDRVLVEGADGRPRTSTLKVSLGYADGFIGEGQISYGGPGAVARARLAMAICEPAPDLRGDETYKTAMAGQMVERALRTALSRRTH